MEFPTDEQAWLDGFDHMHANTVIEHLGIKLEAINADQIVLTMPISDKARQPFGLLHGGISMVLAETAGSVHACWGIDLSKVSPVGIEISGSHVRSAQEGTVRAVGRVVRRSRAMIVHQVEIFLVESGELLCTARVTNYYKPARKDGSQ